MGSEQLTPVKDFYRKTHSSCWSREKTPPFPCSAAKKGSKATFYVESARNFGVNFISSAMSGNVGADTSIGTTLTGKMKCISCQNIK